MTQTRQTPPQSIPRKRKQHSRTGNGRGMLYVMLALAVILLVFMVAVYPVCMVGAPETAVIRIPRDATEKNVNDSLTKYFGADYTAKVMRLVKIRRPDFSQRHGAYEIKQGANALSAMRSLTSGAQKEITVTVNGYRSLNLLIDNLARKFDFSADDLFNALYTPGFLESYGLTRDQALALFVDDSYNAYWSFSPSQLLKKFGDNYLRIWNEERVKRAAALSRTPAEMMIIASITDEETNALQEKGTIGRLYINRLDKGMRLQADPTVRFAVGDFTIRRVQGADLRFDSPYNTYTHKGLPPGPIRTTSLKTIQLILDARPNDYLYMCAKEDFSGTHNFAADYGTHSQNALRYQHALDERGIKK